MKQLLLLATLFVWYSSALSQTQTFADTLKLVESRLTTTRLTTARFILKASVLRYKGQVIDVASMGRDYQGKDEYSVVHTILRSNINSDDALELVSNHGWKATPKALVKHYDTQEEYFSVPGHGYTMRRLMPHEGEPAFLKRTIEVIPLKAD